MNFDSLLKAREQDGRHDRRRGRRVGPHEQGIRGFLVEKGTKGYSAPLIRRASSLRASVTSELMSLEDVHLPKDAMLPKAEGLKAPLSCLTQARYGIAWGAIGSMMAVFDEARALHAVAHPVRQADRQLPARPGEARRDPHHATHAQLTRAPHGPHEGRREAEAPPRELRQAQQRPSARECAAPRPRAPRRQRDLRRLPGRPATCATLSRSTLTRGRTQIHTLVLGEDITGIPAYK